jgi:predicted metalloprotease with PDZ domain
MRCRTFLFLGIGLLASIRLADAADSKRASFGFAFSYPSGQSPMRLAVCAVVPKGRAEQAGLRLDDRIVAVDGRADFKNAFEVLTYLMTKHAGEKLELDVQREKEKRKISIIGAEATKEDIARMERSLRLAKEEAERSANRYPLSSRAPKSARDDNRTRLLLP